MQKHDAFMNKLIPTKNPSALVSYYLGVFSVIPLFGIILGIPTLFFGIMGMKAVFECPTRYGRFHAWVGILLGGSIFIFYISIAIYAIFSLLLAIIPFGIFLSFILLIFIPLFSVLFLIIAPIIIRRKYPKSKAA
nr:putative uncharacterized protein [uncultured bacterium]